MTTNILIVGNGFDLSHYLPTKYDHFMMVMQAIEKWEGKGEMKFYDLFDLNHEKEGWFFQKIKKIYNTDEIKISIEQVKQIKEQLKENVWYQYFLDHVKEVKTWIDFEQKIEEVLLIFVYCFNDLKNITNNSEMANYLNINAQDEFKISEKMYKILNIFNLWSDEKYSIMIIVDGRRVTRYAERSNINFKYCYGGNIQNGLNASSFLDFLQNQLDKFIEIFNLYLLIIDKLEQKKQFKIIEKYWQQPNEIYSFNYTNSYQKFYDREINIEFLHGKFGENQNIVLGVNDLESEDLRKLKAFGFTKYHQKLFLDTDYLFLDKYKKHITRLYRDQELKTDTQRSPNFKRAEDHSLNALEYKHRLDLKVYIWGHSLDVSDQDYIIDLFSLNDDLDRNVRVVVYYFDPNAKFSLLNNLLAILGKDKVEYWMKNRWLKFKENPEINFGITEIQSSES